MITRLGSGWQTILADLSLILFIVTAGALAQTRPSAAEAPQPAPSERAEASAIWQAGPDAPPLATWLVEQSPDARQQLTIFARYREGGQAAAVAQAASLAAQAGEAGATARIVAEPGTGGIVAVLAYDVPVGTVARALHEKVREPNPHEDTP